MLLNGKGGERMYRGCSCREIIEKNAYIRVQLNNIKDQTKNQLEDERI